MFVRPTCNELRIGTGCFQRTPSTQVGDLDPEQDRYQGDCTGIYRLKTTFSM